MYQCAGCDETRFKDDNPPSEIAGYLVCDLCIFDPVDCEAGEADPATIALAFGLYRERIAVLSLQKAALKASVAELQRLLNPGHGCRSTKNGAVCMHNDVEHKGRHYNPIGRYGTSWSDAEADTPDVFQAGDE